MYNVFASIIFFNFERTFRNANRDFRRINKLYISRSVSSLQSCLLMICFVCHSLYVFDSITSLHTVSSEFFRRMKTATLVASIYNVASDHTALGNDVWSWSNLFVSHCHYKVRKEKEYFPFCRLSITFELTILLQIHIYMGTCDLKGNGLMITMERKTFSYRWKRFLE